MQVPRRATVEEEIGKPNSWGGSSSMPAVFDLEELSDGTRAPLDDKAQPLTPFIIGVAGGTASGKTSVCSKIVDTFRNYGQRVVIISQDCFYKNVTAEQKERVGEYNFDHPDAFDWALTEAVLRDLRGGRAVEVPHYDFVTHSRSPTKKTPIAGANIVIFEGILAFHSEAVRSIFDMKIFVDTDADTRLARRIMRDIAERGRDINGILKQYETFVKPAFDTFIMPSKKWADVIIPRGSENLVAIDLIVQHIRAKLLEQAPRVRTPAKKGR